MREVGVVPVAIGEGLRLSLAGAQDKLPVRLVDDKLELPGGATPSLHILKLASRDFPGVCDNEHFMLTLARTVGIPTAASRLLRLHGETALLIERFDRDGAHRLHQEDMCQALGRAPGQKYEADGGPTLGRIVHLLDEASTNPGDAMALVRWQAFNIAIGNADGHAKNLALLREPQVRLAPAYDLVCTHAWESVDRALALSVAGVSDMRAVDARAWSAFADEISMTPRAVVAQVKSITEAVHVHAPKTAARVIEDGAAPSVVRHVLTQVLARTSEATALLDGPTHSIFKRARPRLDAAPARPQNARGTR